jgi:hypothetical protein
MSRIKLIDTKKPENDTEPVSEERNYFWCWVAAVAFLHFFNIGVYTIRWDAPGSEVGAILGSVIAAYVIVLIVYWLSSKL